MGVSSTLPTSRRGYLSQNELAQFADITVTDTTEADDRISQAEEQIDTYVGFQEKFIDENFTGLAQSATSTTLTLNADHQNIYDINYFLWCEIEIIGGTGAGQRRKITGSTKAGVVTVDSAWTTAPDSTSYYKIYQLGKFPRTDDVIFDDNDSAESQYYKSIPENVKRAVAAQVEFQVNVGDAYFNTDKADLTSENIGDYSYSKKTGGSTNLISPKVKLLLRGITNRVGMMVM